MHVILIDTSDKEKKKRKPQMEISNFIFEESLLTIGRISMCVLSVYLLMCLPFSPCRGVEMEMDTTLIGD